MKKKLFNWRFFTLLTIVGAVILFYSLAGTASLLYVNGKPSPNNQGQPVNRAGVLYVPVEAVVKGMGDNFAWLTTNKSAIIKLKDGTKISVYANSSVATVGGKEVPVSTKQINATKVPVYAKPAVISGKLYVPIDFVSDILKYPVEQKKIGSKDYVFVGQVPNELPQDTTPTTSPTPTPSTPTQETGKLDLPFKTPDGWKPPVIKSVSNDDAVKDAQVLKDELGLVEGRFFNPYGGIQPELAQILVSRGDGFTDIGFSAWYGSKTNVHVGNKIPYIARELFKFYLPNDYDKLFAIMNDGYNGKNISTYVDHVFTLGDRQIKIMETPSTVEVYIGNKGTTGKLK